MTNLNLLSTPAVGSTSGRSQSVSASETPLKQNMSSTNVFINGSLEDQRKAVRDDLGPIPEVTVDFMLEHIIPNSNVDVEATMKIIKAGGIWSDTGGWKQFEGLSPRQLARKKLADKNGKKTDTNNNIETQIFRRLKDVYESIISSTRFRDRKTRIPTLYFDQLPSSAPVSDTNVRTRPDCCGVLTEVQTIHTSHQRKYSATSKSSSKSDGEYEEPEGIRGKSKLKRVPKDPDSNQLNWFDIACVEEYKLDNRIEDLNDDVFKIIWSLHHIMHVDHRRRFTFGLTVENEDVRIWFACRQIVLVTQKFNFRTNASQLVQLIASLSYATPAQLGYDPTMMLKWRNHGWQYDIELTTKRSDGSDRKVVYRTIRVLSNTAYNLRGRATRVYQAEAPKDDNDPFSSRLVVLKDSWIDADRPKEGDTLTQLLEGASEEERALFLTIYQHGIVQVDNRDDSTQGLILKGQIIEFPVKKKAAGPTKVNHFMRYQHEALGIIAELPEPAQEEQLARATEVRIFHLFTPKTAASRSSTSKTGNSASEGMPKSQSRNSDALSHNTHHVFDKPIVYSPKVHYRIAFEEVAKSLMQIAGSGMATTRILDRVMCDITMALKYMAKKGYVHRDVSAGNILLFKGRAKLSDLEFAKKYGAGASSYVRTGTYSFMAGEVMKGKYSVEKYANQNASVPFVHNPIHDLESLWWVGVWCLIWHYPAPFTKVKLPLNSNDAGPSNSGPTDEYTYREFNEEELAHIKLVRNDAEELFPSHHSWTNNVRTEEIHSRMKYISRGDDGYPEEVTAMVFRLDNMRQCISWAYMKTQRNLPRTEATYFTDVLRVANPSTTRTDAEVEDTEDEIQSGIKIPVHDRIVQMLDMLKDKVDVEGAILWPLDSIEHYSKWFKTRERKKTLRSRRHLVYGYTNMDPKANCHDY